jgi:hypothetical protein
VVRNSPAFPVCDGVLELPPDLLSTYSLLATSVDAVRVVIPVIELEFAVVI